MNSHESSKVMASAVRAAQEKFAELDYLLRAEKNQASAHGRLNGGGHLRAVRRIVTDKFRETCTVTCVRIAEICGSGASAYSPLVGEFLATLIPRAIQLYMDGAAPGHGDSHIRQLATKQSIELTEDLTGIAMNTADDLGLGIANGVNVAKQLGGVHIDNRGGAGLFAVNSPKAEQEVNGNQTVTTNTLTQVSDALKEVRAILKDTPLSGDDTEEINDAILIVEREIETVPQNSGRIRRFLSALGKKLESVGIEVAVEVLKKLLIN